MNIYVGGANGVGKSTILRRAAQIDKRLEIIQYTSALMQAMGLEPGDYDGLHRFPQSERIVAADNMMKALVARVTTKIRLIDGHYLTLVYGQIDHITKDWIGLMDGLVLISADPNVIWARIKKDEAVRDRELFANGTSPMKSQKLWTEYVHDYAQEFDRLSGKYQKDHFILTHNDDDVERAARQLINFINTLNA